MSGIVGLVNLDGAPVNRSVLARLTASLRFRGPDAERLWIQGPVGLGHTLLATTDEATQERQPCTLDGAVWIVADARVDARDELRRELESRGRAGVGQATDVELILHAYRAWGDACVDHLIGDYAFAIWDASANRLFCARDHFGVKPFFYAPRGRALVFSNTLDTVRLAPSVSDDLDELAIADYLLFKRSLRADATAWADIRRLPAGHCLTWTPAGLTIRRFWAFSERPDLRYRTDAEYVEHFRELFTSAVRDRLRTRRVAVSLSGGLDSPLVTATAKAVLSETGSPYRLVGHTLVYDHLIPDDERKYTTMVATALDMRVQFHATDAAGPFDGWDNPLQQSPEPGDISYRGVHLELWSAIAADARVVFTGSDADGLLNEAVYLRFQTMFGERQFSALSRDVAAYVTAFHRRPPIGLRALVRRATGSTPRTFPAWLAENFVKRLDLRSRWREYLRSRVQVGGLRPVAMRAVPNWGAVFEAWDPQLTRQPLEFRHPFADKRVVDFLLAIPVVPWCTEKTLLRVVARGVLPEAVRTRAKASLATNPMVEHFRLGRRGGIDEFRPVPELGSYINLQDVPRFTGTVDDRVNEQVRPFILNWWLRNLAETGSGAKNEESSLEGETVV